MSYQEIIVIDSASDSDCSTICPSSQDLFDDTLNDHAQPVVTSNSSLLDPAEDCDSDGTLDPQRLDLFDNTPNSPSDASEDSVSLINPFFKTKKTKSSFDWSPGSSLSTSSTEFELQSPSLLTEPTCETQSVDMAGGSGENLMKSPNEKLLGDVKDVTENNENHPEENMDNGVGETFQYRNTSSKQVENPLKRRSDEMVGGSEKKNIKTEVVKDNKRTVKNKQDPDTKHFQEAKNQPKTKNVPLSSASGSQKDEHVNIDERNKEDDELNSKNSGVEFPLVSSRSQQPSGSFTDTHGHVETVLESGAKVQASYSVCKIYYPVRGGNANATGFRVGSRYIMTAAHVTDAFLEGLRFAAETYAQFNYKLDGIFREEDKYLIKGVVYSNKETDIAVMELMDHPNGFPPSLTAFLPPSLEGFYLIGHSQGSVMKTNFVYKIVDKNSQQMQHTLCQLREMSLKHTSGRGYDTPPYNTVDNPYRFLFQCKFTKGASGAPGIVLIGETIYVTTVLLHGYPDWYFDTSMEIYKSNWLPEHCVQQGVDLMSVRNLMQATHPDLCQDIFGIQQ